MDVTVSAVYLPSAIVLGALHALEPGHAKTLTAAYLIGTKGTKRDAIVLGLSVAITHSLVVVLLSILAVVVGRETFTDQAMYWLQVVSGVVVVLLGSWMLIRRLRIRCKSNAAIQPSAGAPPPESAAVSTPVSSAHSPAVSKNTEPENVHVQGHSNNHAHPHGPDHSHEHGHSHNQGHSHEHEHPPGHGPEHSHDHDLLSDDEHAKAHAATLPEYVQRGERPTLVQIIAFGAAGGMIPCPASVTVMLLALSVQQAGTGLLLVLGFSVGLALTLVSIGLAVVAGLSQLSSTGRFAWLTRQAPIISASMVILSGLIALVVVASSH